MIEGVIYDSKGNPKSYISNGNQINIGSNSDTPDSQKKAGVSITKTDYVTTKTTESTTQQTTPSIYELIGSEMSYANPTLKKTGSGYEDSLRQQSYMATPEQSKRIEAENQGYIITQTKAQNKQEPSVSNSNNQKLTGYQKRAEALVNRENKINQFEQNVFEKIGIANNPKGNWFIEQVKGVARFPLLLPTGAFKLGGRMAFAGESLFNEAGRQELKSAFGRVPGAVVQQYNPKNPDFTANVLATGIMYKSALKSAQINYYTKSLSNENNLKVGYLNLKGKGETIKAKGGYLVNGKPVSETTIIKDIRNPSESFTMLKTSKDVNIFIDRNAQTTTTSIFKGNKLLKQTKEPSVSNSYDLKLSNKPKTTIKEVYTNHKTFTTDMQYLTKRTSKYKLNEFINEKNKIGEIKGNLKVEQKTSNIVVGKNPVTIIKKSQLEIDLNTGKVNPIEVQRTFDIKNIQFVFDKEVPKYKTTIKGYFDDNNLFVTGKATKPKYSQVTTEAKTITGQINIVELTTKPKLFEGKKAELRTNVFEQTPTNPSVQVSVKTPTLETPKVISIPKSSVKISEPLPKPILSFNPKTSELSSTNQNVFETNKPKTSVNLFLDTKTQSKVENEITSKYDIKALNKIESAITQRQQSKVSQSVKQNVQQEIKNNFVQEIKQEVQQARTQPQKIRTLLYNLPKTPTVFVKPKLTSFKSKQNQNAGFDVFVRRKGIFERVTNKPLVKSQAINFGAFVVGQEASASFKVVPSSQKATGSFSGNGMFSNFYKSRKESNVFIQKKSKRISSFGEKREITFKGLASLKNKKKVWGV